MKMKTMKFNINDTISVQLTDLGKDILLAHEKSKGFRSWYTKDSLSFSFQLWEFANIFGGHFYNGQKQIIINNIMLIND